jgi:hypothetical protein
VRYGYGAFYLQIEEILRESNEALRKVRTMSSSMIEKYSIVEKETSTYNSEPFV